MQSIQISARRVVELTVLMTVFTEPEQILEKIKIGEQRGEMLAIAISVVVRNQFAVETNLTSRGNVETGQQFHERCLATAVATSDPDRLAGLQGEIDWTE